jgi:hypothetical protein
MVLARQTRVTQVLNGAHQLRVPMYQRRYSWDRAQWDALWDDIAQLALDRKKIKSETHFLGSVVLAKTPAGAAGSRDLLVIDGQQRLVTVSLLLCALRDGEARLPIVVRNRISRCLLVRNNGKPLGPSERLKVLPTQFDQDAFSRLVNTEEPSEGHRATKAYSHFADRLKNLADDQDEAVEGISVEEFAQTTLDGLECVHVTAEPKDNVHRIFESLNNRGMELTQADLIRNYVFMRLDKKMEDFHEYTWKPLEAKFTPKELTQLFWLDLVRDRPTITQRQTYVEQQKKLERLKSQTQLKNAIQAIAARGNLWELILHPEKESNKKVRMRLQRLHEWQTTTVWPVLMYLLERRQNSGADSTEIARAMRYLESYFVRRVVMGRATMNMNRVLIAAPAALDQSSETVDVALREYLSVPGKHWASDVELRDEVADKAFYNHGKAHQKTLILKWIEQSLGDNEVEFSDDFTIEHVMPQRLTPAWKAELRRGARRGDNLAYLHAQLLHTLGNLTLTKTERNGEMSNKSFQDKKRVLARSGLQMTKDITKKHVWGPEDIRTRSNIMVERIIKNWPGPRSAA